MSNVDTELFELCKEVYEKFPEWTGTGSIYYHNRYYKASKDDYTIYSEGYGYDMSNGYTADFEPEYGDIPLYTSDYLLEKLPKHIEENRFQMYVGQYTGEWYAWYLNYFGGQNSADTPLKALLKLAIALHEAGVKL